MSSASTQDDVQPLRDCSLASQQQQQQQQSQGQQQQANSQQQQGTVPSFEPSATSQHLPKCLNIGWCESKRYQVQEVIGKGSYGVVFAAVDTATGARVAIKKIQSVFDNVADATRILREIKLLRLLKHPGEWGGVGDWCWACILVCFCHQLALPRSTHAAVQPASAWC